MDKSIDLTVVEEKIVKKANHQKVPLTANFELTPLCNLSCSMCYIKMTLQELKEKGGLLSVQTWLHIAEQLKKKGTLFILLTGGEPLLYPNFIELYIKLRQMGFIITINTNGTLITEDIAQLFGTLKPRRINVTLYGSNNQMYQKLCSNAMGYEKCIYGIRLLKKYDIDTKLNVSVVKTNLSDYYSIFKLANDLQIPLEVNSYMFPCVRTLCASSKNIQQERLLPEEAAQTETAYIKYKKGHQYNLYKKEIADWFKLGIPNFPPLGLDCRAGKSSCWINWQGSMSPCVAMEEPLISLKEFSVDDAWKFIVEESERLEKHSECEGCRLRPICDVCYAAACQEKKAVGNLSHLCEMAHWKKKFLLEE